MLKILFSIEILITIDGKNLEALAFKISLLSFSERRKKLHSAIHDTIKNYFFVDFFKVK